MLTAKANHGKKKVNSVRHLKGGGAFLTGVVVVAGDLPETVVERQVVADGVLPAGLVAAVEGEVGGNVLVDLAEGQTLLGRALYRHGDEGRVGVGRPYQAQHFVRAVHGEPGAAVHMRQEAPQQSGATEARVWAALVGVGLVDGVGPQRGTGL